VFFNNSFNSTDTLWNVLEQSSVLMILAAGMTIVLIGGGIDLSIGSLLALCGVVTGRLLIAGYGVGPAVAAGIAVGGLCGLINGVVIVTTRVPPFIVTLGMLMAARGLAAIVGMGHNMTDFPAAFKMIGGGYAVPIGIAAAVVLLAAFLLIKTRFGFHVYAVGGNEEVARLSGIPVKRAKLATYALMGLLAGLAAVVETSRLGVALPSTGEARELTAIAAVVIGGTSLLGGIGGVYRTIAGVLIVMTLNQGLAACFLDSNYQNILIGLVVVAAVIVDQLQRNAATAVSSNNKTKTMLRAIGVVALLAMLVPVLLRPGGWRTARGETPRVAFAGYSSMTPFWMEVARAAEEQAAELGVEFRDLTQATPDAVKQKTVIDNAIKNGFDGIVIGPVDSRGLEDSLNRAQEAGVAVVVVDQRVDHPVVQAFVATDNRSGARGAGSFIKERLGGTGKLLLLGGTMGNETAEARRGGVVEALEGSGIEVIFRAADWKPERANEITTAELSTHPDINAIFAACDPMIIAAAQVVEKKGLAGKILMVGFDANKTCLSLIKKGDIQATVRQDPRRMGSEGMALLYQVLQGNEVPSDVPISAELIDRENVDAYLE
jgi:ribose transport system permease protein